ncbi:MAG: putative toxin-antitoxin system toxin component, PIN family [Pseudomonadota bacterium]
MTRAVSCQGHRPPTAALALRDAAFTRTLVAFLIPSGMPVRVVIDTNVFVGACLGQGAAAEVLRRCLTGAVQPLMGSALLAEYEDVLARSDLMQSSRLTAAERDELLDIFMARCEWTRVYFGWRPNLPDEADNHLVELAVAGGAQVIVTRNLRDFARAELNFPGLRCLAPGPFLKEMAP